MPTWHGPKAGGSHTTVIEAAMPLVRKAEVLDDVKRISPGFIKPTPGRPGFRRVKFDRMNGVLRVTIRGQGAVQQIWVYTDHPQRVQQLLEKT